MKECKCPRHQCNSTNTEQLGELEKGHIKLTTYWCNQCNHSFHIKITTVGNIKKVEIIKQD